MKFSPALLTLAFILLTTIGMAPSHGDAQEPATVYLEEMTSPELRARIADGNRTILVPIGGTEQNGAHMVLGKHNVRARILAGMIARQLGHAIVAPVISYVPEGAIHPPQAHMRFAGTISVPVATFESLLEGTARSFRQHGFHRIIFLGDHGDYQQAIARTAQRLNREWASDPSCRAYALPAYYEAGQTAFAEHLKAQGFSDTQIGTHAGLLDTSLALAIDPALVRTDLLGPDKPPVPREGVRGDPRAASPALGLTGVRMIVDASVAAIRKLPPLE